MSAESERRAIDEVRTVQSASILYGEDGPRLDDPAETYHEASKLYPTFARRQTRGHLLEASYELQVSTLRAVKRNRHSPTVKLPKPALPPAPLPDLLSRRRSTRVFGHESLTLDELSTLIHAAYGVTAPSEQPTDSRGQLRRTVPSGGALYPLEVYVFAWRIEGLAEGLYHFDPLRRVLETTRSGELNQEVASAMVYEEAACGCGALFVMSAMFWRTRFKYGLRGYRFALLEAGHVAQNLQLAAEALGLGSVPLGGFYDSRLDELLGLDGVNESTLYCVAVGRTDSPP
jgi:SagB-type dehydrogenase family enzyme